MRLWAKAPVRRRPRRVARKIEKRSGLLHLKLALATDRILKWNPVYPIFDMLDSQYVLSCRKNPYLVRNMLVFHEFRKNHANAVVAQTKVRNVHVSTVFLTMMAPSYGDGPMFFETMIGGGAWDGQEYRYATYEEAKEHHAELVALIEEFHGRGNVMGLLSASMQ